MKLSKNSMIVLKKRFLKEDENPEDMFRRVAKNIAKADRKYGQDYRKAEKEFFEVMKNLEFLPNAPTLRNAGRELQQLNACFVLPVEDSIDGIFQAVKDMALIQKSGGGTGFSFSRLRPEGSKVKETGGIASGPVSFMDVFNAATGAIKEGGVRRGANMAVLRVDHPDILKFIMVKRDPNKLTNFNISVGITNKFMNAVKNNKKYDLVDPRTKKSVKKINAKKVFDLMAEMAWLDGEPGVIFLDEINKNNPTPKLGEIESTNPCAEAILLPYESCNLGSINLNKFIKDGKIDYERLRKVVQIGVHFLDNVIDVTKYPFKKIEEVSKSNRKIGLGVMGFADILIKLGIRYDSIGAVKLAEKIMKFIQIESKEESMRLAKQKGIFPNYGGSVYCKKMRNATTTSIAPTGTLSIIADCSSSIEPIFGRKYSYYAMDKNLVESKNFKGASKKVYLVAHDIKPEWHIRIQAAFQKYTGNGVSKTVNLKNDASKNDIKKVFLLAHKLKIKGITVYRNRSRKKQILNLCGMC